MAVVSWIVPSLSPKIHVHLEPQHVTLFGNRAFTDVISSVSWDKIILYLGCVLNPMTGVLTKGEDTERHREEHNGKMKVKIGMMHLQVKQCQRLPTNTRSYETGKRRFLRQSPEGTNPAGNLIFDFWLPILWGNKLLLFQPTQFVVICYSSLRKLLSQLIN